MNSTKLSRSVRQRGTRHLFVSPKSSPAGLEIPTVCGGAKKAAGSPPGQGSARQQPSNGEAKGKRREKLPRTHTARGLAEKTGSVEGFFPKYVEEALAACRRLLSDWTFTDQVRAKFQRRNLNADEGVQAVALRLLNPDVAAGYQREKGSHEQFALRKAGWMALERSKRGPKPWRQIPEASDATWSGLSPLEEMQATEEAARRERRVGEAVADLSPALRAIVKKRYFGDCALPQAVMTTAECCAHSRAKDQLEIALKDIA